MRGDDGIDTHFQFTFQDKGIQFSNTAERGHLINGKTARADQSLWENTQ